MLQLMSCIIFSALLFTANCPRQRETSELLYPWQSKHWLVPQLISIFTCRHSPVRAQSVPLRGNCQQRLEVSSMDHSLGSSVLCSMVYACIFTLSSTSLPFQRLFESEEVLCDANGCLTTSCRLPSSSTAGSDSTSNSNILKLTDK